MNGPAVAHEWARHETDRGVNAGRRNAARIAAACRWVLREMPDMVEPDGSPDALAVGAALMVQAIHGRGNVTAGLVCERLAGLGRDFEREGSTDDDD